MKTKYNLPKPYLSYSAIQTWLKNKDEYRARYYEDKPYTSTVYTIFGSKVHKDIEDGKLEVKDHPIPQYTNEVKMLLHIDDVPVLGYIDLLDEESLRLADIKTGLMMPDGKPRWTRAEVQKLDQLPFYQLLVKEKYGKVHRTAGLIWLVTEWETVKNGIATDSNLRLTGDQHAFRRVIAQRERDRMRDLIVKVAQEVSEDYKYYKTVRSQ